MRQKKVETVKSLVERENRNEKIYTLFNEGNMTAAALAKKYDLSVGTIYQIVHAYKKESLGYERKTFDKAWLRGAASDRIRASKKEILKIVKALKRVKAYGLLKEYYGELRRWEELEMRVSSIVKPDSSGGNIINVFTGDIRGRESEEKVIEGEIESDGAKAY